ncbi:MAG: hypothetical protein JWM26_1517 [Betaproteobacteria bacterium]|nr:hypothetical protein [Betaproteobacteria bacterium]
MDSGLRQNDGGVRENDGADGIVVPDARRASDPEPILTLP